MPSIRLVVAILCMVWSADALGGKPWLVETYEQTIIGGFGAFAMAANSRADFARALRDKMVLEISGIPPARREDLAARVR